MNDQNGGSPQSYQGRVRNERYDLNDNMKRLRAFLDHTPAAVVLSDAERDRMERQYAHMAGYLAVLDERIAAF